MARARAIRELNLARRVYLAGAVLAAVVAVAFAAFLGAVRASQRDADQHVRVTRAATTIDRVQELVVDLENGMRGFVLSDDPRFLQPWQSARRALPGATAALVAAMRSDPTELATARHAQALALAYLRSWADPLVALAHKHRRQTIRVIDLGAGERKVGQVRATLASLSSSLAAVSQRHDQAARSAAREAKWIALCAGVTAILLILFIIAYITRAVSRPIVRIGAAAEEFATRRVVNVPESGSSEIRRLARAFNTMAAARSAARQRLEERNAELEAVRAEAERANMAKTEFLSRTSHELRTPLNSILGFAQLLAMDEMEPTRRRQLDQVINGGRHLLSLIDELLQISRIETGEMAISPEPVAVGQLLAEVVTMVEPLAAANEVRLELEPLPESELYARADQQRLKQVLLNLLSNAIKYNERGGRAIVSCRQTDDCQIRLEVRDTGPGLSEDEQRRLFVPFERLGRERSLTEGTGLGLALARNFVRLMGGELSVASAPGAGATFSAVLPGVAEAELIPDIPPAPAHEPDEGLEPRRSILYIEDNPTNFRLLQQALEHHPVAALHAVMQGSVGLELARADPPDLVLLDLHLPDMDGEQVLRALKRDARTKDIPVIVLSADVSPRQISQLVDAGAHAYLTKPIDISLFLRTIDSVLGRATPVPA